MREKATSPEGKALEAAAKYICNLQDGRCPLVMDDYRCQSACAMDTQPWRCWIDHFLTATGVQERTAAKDEIIPDFSRPSQPRDDQWGNYRPAADQDW